MRKHINKSIISKKIILVIVALLVIGGVVIVANYTPTQELEVGEYKNYQIR